MIIYLFCQSVSKLCYCIKILLCYFCYMFEYILDEAAATYETRDARGRFRGGRARTFGRNQQNNRRPAAAARPSNNRRPAARPAPRRQQQQPRGGRGLIPIPVPHRGPARNRLINRQAAATRAARG